MLKGIIVLIVILITFVLFIFGRSKNIEKPGDKCYYNALEEEIKQTKK